MKQVKEITHQKNLPASYEFLTFKASAHPYVPCYKIFPWKLPAGPGFLPVSYISFLNKSKNLWLVGCDGSLGQYAWELTQCGLMSFHCP